MSLNETPRANRVHIALFGRTNAGKSSVINAITNQNIALVSAVKGTTTDPVYKSMELLPIGPVVLIDTAGLDDESELGELRKQKTLEVLNKTDLALLVLDAEQGVTAFEEEITAMIKQKNIPLIGILNKTDLCSVTPEVLVDYQKQLGLKLIPVSAAEKKGISQLKTAMIQALPDDEDTFRIVGDLLNPGDFVVLVVPIDKAAPKGRLILPQQQVIRDVLESDGISIVTKEYELKETLENLHKKPKIVITDSQAFLKVAADTPREIPLTSFSILMARYKGDLAALVKGAKAISKLQDGDKVLIAEACTHHRQADDIGRVKIPRWLKQMTGKQIVFEFSSGTQFPQNLQDFALVVHCGGCMLNRREMNYRIQQVQEDSVPIVNYGVLIAYVQGILERVIEPFPLIQMIWDEQS